MDHLPNLVHDLALILITAGITTVLFKWLKQPVVLGYIVAGFLVGPHIHLFPSVIDSESIATWSEIGIIFLLFALGLEFRFKKLIEVGRPALVATAINMGAMIGIGYLTGLLLEWSSMESLFLGGMLSMASTTIIIKAFNDMNQQNQRFAGIVFGILIIEDLAAILMMVLFSTIAVSKTFEGLQLLENLLKLIFFIVIWFVVGIFVIPSVLKKIKRYLNDETLLILAAGLCFGMVLLAHAVGFSDALGAFIMGSILAETIESKRIERLVLPLKNLFGAVFFVSVGMMIVPGLIWEYIVPVMILSVVVIFGRIIFATLGVLASGESLKISILSGFSLAQIGEFSFIIATLGIQLGVITGDFIYPVIIAVSVVTTFTTPYGIRYSEKIYYRIEKLIPPKWNRLIAGYSAGKSKHISKSNTWRVLLQRLFIPTFIYFILSVAVVLLAKLLVIPFLTTRIAGVWGVILAAVVSISLMAPFLYGMIRRREQPMHLYFKLLAGHHLNKWILIPLSLIDKILCVALILSVLMPLFPGIIGILFVVSLCILIFISFNPRYEDRVKKIEALFLRNLNVNDYEDEK